MHRGRDERGDAHFRAEQVTPVWGNSASSEEGRTILPAIECLEDSYVLRWLRAKDLRFDETADALKKHVVFRKAWELDAISSWEAPEVSITYFPHQIYVGFIQCKSIY
uniref:CRAL_TRIO_N domain-containing protein n=1 Tax=Angiostrongylus cantonensis TaxID=6313 RepID=A0A0K0CVN6_ANGCA